MSLFDKAEVVDPPHFAGGFTLQIALELKPLGLLFMNGIDSGGHFGDKKLCEISWMPRRRKDVRR